MQTEWNFDYTGAEQSVTLKPAKYKLECWGASGGA
ncbi:glycine-rich protein, partial [Clostridioides difficile]